MPEINNRQRGFFTFAQNNSTNDYVRMAYALALSLKASQTDIPYLTLGITPGTTVPEQYAWAFDNIMEIIWGDDALEAEWKLNNEWKSIYMTPYVETIKLDCDMLFFGEIASWWGLMSTKDFWICNTVLNYKAQIVNDDFYRKTFTINNLPDVYTGFMYFKKTDSTFELFKLVELIYKNWGEMSTELLNFKDRPETPSTDVVFALALKILDIDQIWYQKNSIPTFTHMKTRLQKWNKDIVNEDWSIHISSFFNKKLECKIGNYSQVFPLHYHRKDFLTDEIISYYEKVLNGK
jgi:hypothetical protein